MTVYVNNISVRLFPGATAREAVMRYCTDTGRPYANGTLYDAWGNIIAHDSPMNEGRRIFTSPPC